MLLSSVGNDIFSKNAVTDARSLADYQKAAREMYGADADDFLKLFPAKNDAEAANQAQAIARITGFEKDALSSAINYSGARRSNELRSAIALLEAARRRILSEKARPAHGN